MGLFNATTALAGIMGAALGGWAAEHWGYQASLGLAMMGVTLGLILAFTLQPVSHSWYTLKPVDGKRLTDGEGS